MKTLALHTLAGLLLACMIPAQAAVYRIAQGTEAYLANDMGLAVLTEAYRRLGHTLTQVSYPLERALLMANAGETDGDMVRAQVGLEQQYPNLRRIPTAIAHDEFVAYGRSKKITIKGWESLAPYRLSGLRIKKLQQLGPDYDISFVKNFDAGFEMLRAGRVDFVVMMRGTRCLVSQRGFLDAILQEPGIESVPFYHYLNVRHTKLAKELDDTLRTMQKDGSLKRIQSEVLRNWDTCP